MDWFRRVFLEYLEYHRHHRPNQHYRLFRHCQYLCLRLDHLEKHLHRQEYHRHPYPDPEDLYSFQFLLHPMSHHHLYHYRVGPFHQLFLEHQEHHRCHHLGLHCSRFRHHQYRCPLLGQAGKHRYHLAFHLHPYQYSVGLYQVYLLVHLLSRHHRYPSLMDRSHLLPLVYRLCHLRHHQDLHCRPFRLHRNRYLRLDQLGNHRRHLVFRLHPNLDQLQYFHLHQGQLCKGFGKLRLMQDQ